MPAPRELTPNESAAHLFGAELRLQRQRQGLSLERLCTLLAGRGYRTVAGYLSNVEAGARLPRDRHFADVCDDALEAGGVLGRLWDFADAERYRDRGDRAQQREAVLELAAGALALVLAGEAVYVPVVSAVDTIEYVKLTRRAFLAYGAALAGGLGVLTPDELDRLTLALDQPQRADQDVAECFRQLLAVQKSYDYKIAPAGQIGPAVQQIGVLDRLCRDADSPIRPALRSVQAEYAEYAGWLHQHLGNPKTATHWTDKAIVWAQAGGDYQIMSFAIGRKINLAMWGGPAAEAAELADSARRVPWKVPPGLASINAQYEARAHAMRGDETRTLAVLDEARELLGQRQQSGEDRIYWARHHTETYLNANEAHCHVELGRIPAALDLLGDLVPDGEAQPRQSGPLALLAWAHARSGDPQAAAAAGEKALTQPVSANTRGLLATASKELRRWDEEETVQSFRSQLAGRQRPEP
jgi:hypothetical protein